MPNTMQCKILNFLKNTFDVSKEQSKFYVAFACYLNMSLPLCKVIQNFSFLNKFFYTHFS